MGMPLVPLISGIATVFSSVSSLFGSKPKAEQPAALPAPPVVEAAANPESQVEEDMNRRRQLQRNYDANNNVFTSLNSQGERSTKNLLGQ